MRPSLPSGATVTTALITPASTSMRSTSVSSQMVAPCMRAPRARAIVMSLGLACPSVGRNAAPTTSSISISGHRCCASLGVSRCISSPKLLAVVACRFTSVQRSSLHARRRPPFIFQPVACPVSASRVLYSSTELPSSWVMLALVRSWPTKPAAWKVLPEVSLCFSSSTVSVQPSFARWYAVEQPTMPPPMTTVRAAVGSAVGSRATAGILARSNRDGRMCCFVLECSPCPSTRTTSCTRSRCAGR